MDVTGAWLRLAGTLEPSFDDAPVPPGLAGDDWDRYLREVAAPLERIIAAVGAGIAGLTGPPGSGKSTLARLVASKRRGCLVLSMDDFYLTRTERTKRGIRRRGGPGSHDLALLIEVLEAVRARRAPLSVPRFSAHHDDRTDPETVAEIGDLVLLEGWFLGYPGEGYGEIAGFLDLLVFLDVSAAASRSRRFGREEALRVAGGGFDEPEMERFWDEVLEPGIRRLLPAARSAADLVITIGGDQSVRSVEAHSEAVVRALRSV